MRKLVFALAAITLAACGGTDVDTTTTPFNADIKPSGRSMGLNPDNYATPSKTAGSRTNGISFHGGPVMLGSVPVYIIWYGNWSGNSGTTLLPKLIGDLNGSSYEHINTTYYNGSGQHVAGTMSLAAQTSDNYSQGTALSDAQIQAVVEAKIAAGVFPQDTNALYFVLTSSDVNATSGFCTNYCGWHNNYTRSNGANIKFSFVGNPDRCPASCEQQTTSPNGNSGADGMASIMAHESEEAISDPDLNAWYDTRGNENADKCAWTFGTTSTASNGSQYNFTGTSGTHWLIQRNWVNASGGYCSMSY
jgi:hypothetical protein